MQSATATSCSECDSNDVIITKARKSYCKSCWKYHCEYRFRKKLFEFGRPPRGTTGEVFKPAEETIICYDGSPTSVALLNLALNGLMFGTLNNERGAPNIPFPFKFCIVVILESELNGSPGVEGRQKKHLQSLQKWIKHARTVSGSKSQFSLLASSLETSLLEHHTEESVSAFKEIPLAIRINLDDELVSDYKPIKILKTSSIDDLPLPFNESLDCHLMELRKSLKTKTDDKDFIGIIKKNLLCAIAEQLKINKIILPEDQTSLAVKMFSMMSLGRGSQVADEMAFTSTVGNGIILARPLVDFSDDDLRAYLETLSEEFTDGLVGKGAKRKMKIDSVERQCDDFIVNLQKGYPATVSTLTRIGAKLVPNPDSMEVSHTLCRFCKKQIESASEADGFCYGCQHFLVDAHPNKKEFFKNLFTLKDGSNS